MGKNKQGAFNNKMRYSTLILVFLLICASLVFIGKLNDFIFNFVNYEDLYLFAPSVTSEAAFDAVLQGLLPYKDFYIFYGPLYPLTGAPLYFIKSPWAKFVFDLVLPLIPIFVLGRLVNRKKRFYFYALSFILAPFVFELNPADYRGIEKPLVLVLYSILIFLLLSKFKNKGISGGIVLSIIVLIDQIFLVDAFVLVMFSLFGRFIKGAPLFFEEKKETIKFLITFFLITGTVFLIFELLSNGKFLYIYLIYPFVSSRRPTPLLSQFSSPFIFILLFTSLFYKKFINSKFNFVYFIILIYTLLLVRASVSYYTIPFLLIPLLLSLFDNKKIVFVTITFLLVLNIVYVTIFFNAELHKEEQELLNIQKRYNYLIFDAFKLFEGPLVTDLTRQAVFYGKSIYKGMFVDSILTIWLIEDKIVSKDYIKEMIEKNKPQTILLHNGGLIAVFKEFLDAFYYTSYPYVINNPLSCPECSNGYTIFLKNETKLNYLSDFYKNKTADNCVSVNVTTKESVVYCKF